MKVISASIIVLAGLMCFGFGITVDHDDTQIFVCAVGLLVAVVGLVGWFLTMMRAEPRNG